jgi:starvation-inducible outer membrane lipoprotein
MKMPLAFFICMCVAVMTLSACGTKPDKLTGPQGKEADTFPRSYPEGAPRKGSAIFSESN